MADRISEYVLSLGADDSDLRALMTGIKGRMRDDTRELERITSNIELFKNVSSSVDDLKARIEETKKRISTLADEMKRIKDSGAQPTKQMTDRFSELEKQLAKTSAELTRQVSSAASLQTSLKAAGVDTANLAAEQTRLAKAVADANAAAAQQGAKDLLGFKSLTDVTPKIQELQQAFLTLKASGKLSAEEIAVAQSLLNDKIKETRETVSTLSSGAKTGFAAFGEALTSIPVIVAGITASFAGVTAAISAATTAAKDFENELARVGSITDLSKGQLADLSEGVRKVAQEFGLTLVEAEKALYDVIRQGTPANSSLDVLRISAEAARAGFVDLRSAADAADVMMDSFGMTVGDLRAGFDVLITSQKAGGLTLAEFGAEAGKAANLARAAGLDLQSFVAIVEVMRANNLSTADSLQVLNQLMVKFGDPAVKSRLDDLGISSQNLATALSQLAERNIPVGQIIDLGVGADKASAGLRALTKDASALPDALARAAESAGATQKAFEGLLDTPARRQAEFNAAWDNFKTNMGEVFGTKSAIQAGLGATLRAMNEFIDAARVAERGATGFSDRVRILATELLGLDKGAEAGAEAGRKFAEAWQAAELKKALGDIDVKITSLRTNAAGLVTSLDDGIKALQAGAAQDIASVNARLEAEIAALDKSTAAMRKSADEKIALEEKAANDRFLILKNSETKILEALDASLKQRAKLVADNEEAQKTFAQESIRARIAALGPLLASWREHYQALSGLAAQHAQTLNGIEGERLSFNQAIEAKLFEIRLQGLSSFDQYLAKVKEVERLVAAERQAGAEGDLKRAADYRDQALSVISTISKATSVSGAEIISQGQAQAKQVELITKVRDTYNESLDVSASKERAATQAFASAAADAKETIDDLQKRFDELRRSSNEAVTVKVEADATSFANLTAQLDQLTRSRTVYVTTQTVNGGGGFNQGGYVDHPTMQRFASGGGVWTVPGVGDSDTVPALLQQGSYVLRKSASSTYGQELMDVLASGWGRYADGGSILAHNRAVLRGPTGKTDTWPELMATANQVITDLISSTTGLPPAQWGDDIRNYMARVLEMIRSALSYTDAKALWDRFARDIDSIKVAIAQSHQLGVPLIYWAGSLSGPGAPNPPRNLGVKTDSNNGWSPFMIGKGTGIGNGWTTGFPFARGGGVGDTVPALLTPGEYVLTPPAVRALGTNLLDRINSLSISKRLLSGLSFSAPPLRYAAGGFVPGVAAPERGRSVGGINITINATGADFKDEAAVRRLLLPTIREIERRSR